MIDRPATQTANENITFNAEFLLPHYVGDMRLQKVDKDVNW